MKILAIDTSTKFLCLGAYDEGRIYEFTLETGRQLSFLLGPAVERVITALNWKPRDIDYFVVGLGPGSFTGLRTGISFIKGMSWATKKPVIGISSLDILAGNAPVPGRQIVAAIDAKRGLIYCAVFQLKNKKLVKSGRYMLIKEEELLKKIRKDAIVLGDALTLYREGITANISGVTALGGDYWYPRPRNIITLALEKIKQKKLSNAFDIRPIYLYPKECQIKKA